eukprot:m.13006 g.13006  ORF g.13006 m.13006 type:complete len:146 (+) comp10017_c0_seq1:121-558(+)
MARYEMCVLPRNHDDERLLGEIRECCITIRKAMVEIVTISSGPSHPTLSNQLIRWIATKEDHADKIIDRVSQYFLCERLIPHGDNRSFSDSEYAYRLALVTHHRVLTEAVFAKQETALPACDRLEHAVEELGHLYEKASRGKASL